MAVFAPTPIEIIVVLIIVLIIFGPKRLPDLGRSLGRGMREFKESVTGNDKDERERAELAAPPPQDSVQTTSESERVPR